MGGTRCPGSAPPALPRAARTTAHGGCPPPGQLGAWRRLRMETERKDCAPHPRPCPCPPSPQPPARGPSCLSGTAPHVGSHYRDTGGPRDPTPKIPRRYWLKPAATGGARGVQGRGLGRQGRGVSLSGAAPSLGPSLCPRSTPACRGSETALGETSLRSCPWARDDGRGAAITTEPPDFPRGPGGAGPRDEGGARGSSSHEGPCWDLQHPWRT